MWRVAFILFIVFPFSVFAECVSVDTVTKCARLPNGIRISPLVAQGIHSQDDGAWSALLYDHQSYPDIKDTHQILISGTAEIDSMDVICTITSPFYADVYCLGGAIFSRLPPAQTCAEWQCEMSAEIVASALPNDVCPDGFYTIPYDVLCGGGLVDVSGVPQCEDDTSGDYCLIGGVSAAPCAAGITTLRTGTGVSIPLWAEKSTTPSLCVLYNDTVCYINLKQGQASGSINVKYNDLIYHLVD